MTSNFLSTLHFTANLRHPDSSSTLTGGTDNGGNPDDTQRIPEGSPTQNRSPLGSTTSKKLFTNVGENEAEKSELERVLVSTDGVFYENQADDIRSNLGDLRTVWSQETISITPKKHNNGFAELMKQVREFKADSHKDDEAERNSTTDEAGVNDRRNRKHDINLTEIMEKLAEFRSEITILRDTMESERNGNLVLRHDIEVHKQELLRQIEGQKTIIERQQETILQKELEACRKEREQNDDKIREANVRESIEVAREAQIAQYREEVTNLQKFFDERIQEMSSEHKTYEQTVQQLNTKLLEYENEITRLRNEMETERKHIQGPPSPVKDGKEDSQELITRTNHASDSHKRNRILNERTERFETGDSKPTLLDSSNKGEGNNRQRNESDTDEVHRREVDDDYIFESGEDVCKRELLKPPSDTIDNISEGPTTAFKEKPFTPENILHKDYSQQHIDKDKCSDQQISETDEDFDAHEDYHARDSPGAYGYDNYGYQDLQETQKKFPSVIELEEILNGGDEPGKLSKIPGKNFNGDRNHSVDNMVSQHLMHDQDTRHVWSDVTNTHAPVEQTRNIRSYDANMNTVHAQNNLTIFPRMYGPLDVIQEESIPISPDNIAPDVSNVTYRRDKQQQPCDPHLKKDIRMPPSELVDRSCTELNAQHFPSHVFNENLKDLDMKGLAYRVHRSESDGLSPKKLDRDVEEAYNTHADNNMYHVYPDDSTIIALKKEIDELRKDFEKTKPNDQMSDAAIENLKKEIQTLKKVFEKDEDKNKTYPETEDDKLIECLRNEVQQLKKNLEKIENSKPPVQPNYEDVIDAIRKEIETMKTEQEKNKSETNTTTAEDMAVVIELLKNEIQSIKNDPGKGHDRESTALIYEDVIRRLQDDIEKLKGEHEKPLRKLNTSTNADDDLAMGSVLEETEIFMTSQKKRQDLERTASLLETGLETLKSDFDTMKKKQEQICDRDKDVMYQLELNDLRKEIDAIKTATRNVEQESLQQGIGTEMDSIKKEFNAQRKQQDKIRYQTETSPVQPYPPNVDLFDAMRQETETSPVQPYPPNVNSFDTMRQEIETSPVQQYPLNVMSFDTMRQEIATSLVQPYPPNVNSFDTMRQEIETIKDTLEKLKTKLMEMGFNPSQTNQEAKVTKTNELEEKQQENEMYQLKKITATNTDYDQVIDSLRNDIHQLKEDQKKRQDTEMASTIEAKINALVKDMEHMKLEQEKIYIMNEEQENRRQLDGTYIGVIRKEMDGLKRDQEKLKQHLEGRQDYSPTPNENIDTLRKDADALKTEKQSLEGRKDYSLTLNEDMIDTLQKDVDALKMEKQSLEGRKDYPLTLNEDIIDTLRKDVDALKMEKQSLEGRKDYSLTLNEDIIDTLRKDVDALKMEKQSLERRKDYSLTPNEDIIDTLRKDVDALKMEKQSLEGRKDYSLTLNEDIIDTLRKDVDALKMEKQSLEGRKDYSLTLNEDIIDTLRKDVDALKMEKQSLEGRKDYSLTLNEDIIDTLRKDVDALKMEKQSLEGRKDYSLTINEDIIDTLRKDVDALKMEKQSQSNEDRCMLEALRSEVDSLRKLQEQIQYQETDSSTLTPGPSDAEEPVLDTVKEGMNKEYILRDAFDQLCYECKQRDEEIEACKEDIKKLFELLQNSLARVDNERQMHVETINEKLAKYSESINKVLTVTKMQSENIEKLVDDTENEKTELRAEVDKYRHLVEGITLELQQEVESLKKSYEQVFTLQQEIENLRTSTEEMDASTRKNLQEMSNLDNDILLRLENLNAAQEDQTENIVSLTETLGQYRSEIPKLQKAMETEREEISDLQRGLQNHRQELREELNNQLTALETHKKEVETKTDAIQAELQELHKVNVQQHKLRKRRQVTELQDPVMKDKISSKSIPVKTTVKDLGSLAADDELLEGGLQRRAKVKELEVTPAIDEIIEETQDTEERSVMSSWFSAVTTTQRRKAKSKSCLAYLGRICCTALPLILLLLLFLIFALFVPFFHECCTRTNTYRHSPMFFRYVDGPPPI